VKTYAEQLKQLMLLKPKLTLAVAESLTAGHLQAQIAAVSGASGYFLGGVTAYNLRQKVKLLGVSQAHARRVNCVSQRVAVEMAHGVMARFGADLAAATTGYAEPDRAAGVKSPMAWWAICQRGRNGQLAVSSGVVEVPDANRVEAQERIARDVLGLLVAHVGAWREQ
jgi:nicotinamide-nucleotide amidase